MKFLAKKMTSGKPARPPQGQRQEEEFSTAKKRKLRALSVFMDDDDDEERLDDEDDDDISLYCEDDESDEETTPTGRKKKSCRHDIRVIASSSEKFISFSKCIELDDGKNVIEARFIDSLRFLNCSLQELAKNLPQDKLRHTREAFPDERLFELATRKGVYPYEYVTDEIKYQDKGLPPHEAFYSSLSGENISDEDYAFALKVYREFECTDLGVYTDLYSKIDVYLLADVFENFRDKSKGSFDLDPCWFVSLPGFAWKAALKTSNTWIELISDYDMLLFFEDSIRGGFCFASKRYAKANHSSLPTYNSNEPQSWILYLDANNLYGTAMSQPLPYRGYEWMAREELDHLTEEGGQHIMEKSDNDYTGYVLEVDLEYPQELHNEHNDLPLCPENLFVGESGSDKKLMATLHNKERYKVHYTYLKHALAQGLQLKKIHRGVKFYQRPWLKAYIDKNTRLRQQATDKFTQDLHKLLNNAVFGKSMENVRNHRDIKLMDTEATITKYVSRPEFMSRTIINEETDLTMIELKKTKIRFNKPLQVGAAILDISKCIIVNFHYNVMKKICVNDGYKLELIYGDTDSLIYHIFLPTGIDLYRDILPAHKEHLDFSNYPTTHPLYSNENKKVPGKFSDELQGQFIAEFVALRPKLYSFKEWPHKVQKKAKGIKKSTVKKQLTFDDYKRVLEDAKNEKFIEQNLFRSYKLETFTIEQRKLALSGRDTKRFTCSDRIHTVAWGHYSINSHIKNEIVLDKKFRKRLAMTMVNGATEELPTIQPTI
jgi:hypothetical protein